MMNGGTMMRDGDESHMCRGQGLSSLEPSAKNAFHRPTVGILIFSLGQELLHMNRGAFELIDHLSDSEIASVNDMIQEALNRWNKANIWEPFELKSIVLEARRKILIRGFGLADRHSYNHSRIVIILEEIGLRQEHEAQKSLGQVYPSESRYSTVEGPASSRDGLESS
jgi:hypothetical protein